MDTPPGACENRFDIASRSVLDYLKSAMPLGFWSVTRYDGASQVFLTTRDDHYGFETGDGAPCSAPCAASTPRSRPQTSQHTARCCTC